MWNEGNVCKRDWRLGKSYFFIFLFFTLFWVAMVWMGWYGMTMGCGEHMWVGFAFWDGAVI